MSGRKGMPVSARIQKGDNRILKVYQKVAYKYSGVPGVIVLPAYGWGTGVDILVTDGTNKILELREVTNFDRFTRQGNPIHINNLRANRLKNSLTRKLYWKRWGRSKKRFYPTPSTRRLLDISYETNILPQHYPLFSGNGIKVEIWNRTEYRKGYSVEDASGNKTYYLDNGTQVSSKSKIK